MKNPLETAMNFFSPTNPNPADTAAATAQKNLSDTNPTKDADGKQVGANQTPVDPLEAYAKMFENANKATENVAPTFTLDPKTLDTVTASMDFTKGIDPAVAEAAFKGDPKAIMEMMQAVGRNSYRASLEHTSKLTDAHLNQRGTFDKRNMEETVKTSLTDQALSGVQNYNNPLVKAELNRVASTLAKANPDMPPAVIAATAQKYIQDMAAALNPANKETTQQTKDENFDWTKYLKEQQQS